MSKDRSPDGDFFKDIGAGKENKKNSLSSTTLSVWENLLISQEDAKRIRYLNAFWHEHLDTHGDAGTILDALASSWWATQSAFIDFPRGDLSKKMKKVADSIQAIDKLLGTDERVALAIAICAHADHVGQDAKVVDVVHGTGKGGLARPGFSADQAFVIANDAFFATADFMLDVSQGLEKYRMIAVTPIRYVPPAYFVKGMLLGQLGFPIDSDGSQAMAIDHVANKDGERFANSLSQSVKRVQKNRGSSPAPSANSLKSSVDYRFAFLPQEEVFICDGSDCGIKAKTSESFARRRIALLEAFTEADLMDECGKVEGVADESALEQQWHAVVVGAASEQEDRGIPGPVLAAHAQDALGISGPKAKALVRAARSRGLLELPRDTIKRFSFPGSFQKPQDLPFPMEGFVRLCGDCFDMFSAQ